MRYTKLQARYKTNAKSKLCKNCSHFKPLENKCIYVAGYIAPNGTSKFWSRKRK